MKIREWSVDTFWKGELRVQAVVEDEGTAYRTRIFIKGSQIYDYSCSCAEGNSYKGPCAHAKCVFAEYQQKAREERRIPVSTSSAVRTMIREYTNRDVARIIGEEEQETVSLVPRLLIGRQSVALECRIAGKRQYLIKNLAEFAEAVRTGKRLEYGKGMAFEHNPSAFEEKCRPLLSLVMDEAGSYVEHYNEVKGKMAMAPPVIRSLTLNRGARDRLCTILMGEAVLAEDYKGLERQLTIVRENPSFTITVRRRGTEGICVTIPPELMAFSGEELLYVADSERLYCCDKEYTDALEVFLDQLLHVRPDVSAGNSEGELTVNKRDIPLFYARVLQRLEELGLLDDEGIDWEEYRPAKLTARFEFDSAGPGEITMKPTLSYGEYSFHPLEDEHIPREICRDVPGEFRVSRLITRYFEYREDGTKNLIIRDDEDAMYRLLREGMERFREMGEVWISESFRALRVLPPPRISAYVAVNSGWLDLTLDTGEMSSTELLKILSEYKQKKKYYRMKNGEFLELSEDGLLAVSRLTEELGLGKNELEAGTLHLPAYRAFYLDSLLREEGKVAFSRDRQFTSMVRDLRNVEDVEAKVPKHLEEILRGYQKTGFSWLKTLDHYGFGGILADDMGLGKTIQILTLLSSVYEEERENVKAETVTPVGHRPSLVVCPASLIYNWGQECETFAPSLKVLLSTGPMEERKANLTSAGEYDVIVTSYELLRRDLSSYENLDFRFQIIDEAQHIKNASTQNAKAVKSIRAKTRFALTGTPVENRLSELWSIFDFLMPGFLFSYRRFKSVFELPIAKEGDKAAVDGLHRMIRPFVLRRLKSDVLKELPEKLEKVYYSAAEGKQHTLYQAAALKLRKELEAEAGTERDALKSGAESESRRPGDGKLEILAQLTRLRQICCDPSLCYENYSGDSAKLETCISLVSSAIEAGHKILLFSQFASMLEIIGKRLEKEGISHYMLTGATSKEERNRMVNAFQKDEVPVFLISLKAGGTGLNLTAADIVIHYDPWWNVAAQNQATDRAHRIGQNRQVTVYKLIMKNTIEENILRLQESKQLLADQIVREGMVSLGELGREELLEILREK